MTFKSSVLLFSFILVISTEYLGDAEKSLSIPDTLLSSKTLKDVPNPVDYMHHLGNTEEKNISDQLFKKIQERRKKKSKNLPLVRKPYLDFMTYLPSRRMFELSIDEERGLNQTLEAWLQIIPSDYFYSRIQFDREMAVSDNSTHLRVLNAKSIKEIGIGGYRDVFHVAFRVAV